MLLTLGICCLHISKGQVNNMPVGPQDWLIKKNYYASYLLLNTGARELQADRTGVGKTVRTF